jgi:hypothetical protein
MIEKLKNLSRQQNMVLAAVMSAGLATDFLFNGVFIRLLTGDSFKETWIYLYAPLEIAVAAGIYNYLLSSKWTEIAKYSFFVCLIGSMVGHLLLLDFHSTRVYPMTLAQTTPQPLLKSSEWPQILFVSGTHLNEVLSHHSANDQIPVTISYETDYGCIRTAWVSNVAGVDLNSDTNINWVWRLNRFANTSELQGPGMEDRLLPWCRHRKEIKDIESGPVADRPWDSVLQNSSSGP